jgi:DNA repair exonuclease SbcCD nuclease subunit
LRLLHTSDLHVGMSDAVDVVAAGLRAVVAATHELQPALLLIAGDLFDTNRVADEYVEFVISQLQLLSCRTLILPGNHDAYTASSVYRRVAFESIVPGVTVIREPHGQRVEYPDLDLVVWGRPIIEHSPSVSPLDGLPEAVPNKTNVIIAHGLIVDGKSRSGRSSPIDSHQLMESGWDYAAIGHDHDFRVLEFGGCVACYSGSPAGVNFGPPLGRVAVVDTGGGARVRVTTHHARA